jgi:hypothetical protein
MQSVDHMFYELKYKIPEMFYTHTHKLISLTYCTWQVVYL